MDGLNTLVLNDGDLLTYNDGNDIQLNTRVVSLQTLVPPPPSEI